MNSIKRYFFNTIIVILAFVIAFSLVELAVRIFCPQEVGPIRFAFNPELGGDTGTISKRESGISLGFILLRITTTPLGMRGSREYPEKKETEYRILMIGDSFTYGFGVNDDQTFAALVEKDLRADRLSVEVMNAGAPGKGTDYELKCFQTVGRKFHPDLTVLGFFCNDFQDNARGEYYNIGKQG